MTPIEALGLLDSLAAKIQLARADHVKVSEAVRVLSEFIKDAKD